MRLNRYYMHENCLDICVYVIRFKDNNPIVLWINLGYVGKPFMTSNMETELTINDINKWHDITEKINVPRTASGLPA